MNNALQIGIIYLLVSVMCGVILLLFAHALSKYTPRFSIQRYVYLSYLLAGISALAGCLTGLTEMEQIPFCEPFAYICMIVNLVCTITSGLFWTCYSEKKQNSWFSRTQKRFSLFLLPGAIVILLIISSPFTHFFFYYENGHYQRGSLFLILTFIILAYCCYTGIAALICSHKKENYADRRVYGKLFAFAASILIIQILQFALQLMFPIRDFGTAIIFGILLFMTMGDIIGVDPLTHLSNRSSMDHRLDELMKSGADFSIVLLDIDKFKTINDSFGHTEGDTALKYVAEAITQSLSNASDAFRMGGDEFVIIGGPSSDELIGIEDTINAKIMELLTKHKYPYKLTVSAGYFVKDDTIKTIPDLLKSVDQMMYKRKAQK